MRDDGPLAGRRRSLPGFVVAGRWRAGAGGAPAAIRGGGVSESVAKAPRGGIGGEKKRGISTILFRCFGAILAFATDLDNPRRRGPSEEERHLPDGDHDELPGGWTGPAGTRPTREHVT